MESIYFKIWTVWNKGGYSGEIIILYLVNYRSFCGGYKCGKEF